ncbi:hypothetical protein GWN42_03285 [candidate division KSB1 bacterium]|nr:hypothetical protein [candidate division KSB1 bacterium]
MRQVHLGFVLVILTVTIMGSIGCSSSNESHKQKLSDEKRKTISEERIGSHLLEIVQKLQSTEVPNPSTLSSSKIKVDDQGNIQCYIYLTETSERNFTTLKSATSEIDLINREQNIVQAWIPHGKIREVGELNFVEKITAPDYAVKLRDKN